MHRIVICLNLDHMLRLVDEPIHFALLVPRPAVSKIAGAAELAVQRINNDKALLPGRQLKYRWADSGCTSKQGLAAMGKLLGEANRVDAVIGPACSSACEVTSYLAAGQGIPQISYSCTAASLSNKKEHCLVSMWTDDWTDQDKWTEQSTKDERRDRRMTDGQMDRWTDGRTEASMGEQAN